LYPKKRTARLRRGKGKRCGVTGTGYYLGMVLFYVFVSGYEFRRLVCLVSLFYVFVSGYEFRRLVSLVI